MSKSERQHWRNSTDGSADQWGSHVGIPASAQQHCHEVDRTRQHPMPRSGNDTHWSLRSIWASREATHCFVGGPILSIANIITSSVS